MAVQFLWAFCATGGYCLIFNVPRRHIPPAAIVGACGWLTFQYLVSLGHASITACFFGACLVALLSEIFSRIFKETSTVFVIPGILPLVPGTGMYNTMLAFLESDFQKTASVGWETCLMAGSIAAALLITTSIFRLALLALQGVYVFVQKRL